jgi:hypothetical protein
MNFSEWGELSVKERENIKWHRKPHIKTATLFTIVLSLFTILFVVGLDKNETSHLNRKPTAQQAYNMAQGFVKEKLKLPASAVFLKNGFESQIDTVANTYMLNGSVNAQATDGHFVKQKWITKLKFTGGDWANRKSWVVEGVKIN